MSIWDDAPANSKAVYDYLMQLAGEMRTITYGEIGAEIGRREGRAPVAAQSLNRPLRFIRDEVCRKNGLPWLNVLAVNNETRMPGDAFLPAGTDFGGELDERVLWRGAVLAVFAYPWDKVDI